MWIGGICSIAQVVSALKLFLSIQVIESRINLWFSTLPAGGEGVVRRGEEREGSHNPTPCLHAGDIKNPNPWWVKLPSSLLQTHLHGSYIIRVGCGLELAISMATLKNPKPWWVKWHPVFFKLPRIWSEQSSHLSAISACNGDSFQASKFAAIH